MKKLITAAVIATFALSSPASAAVTFDAETGRGFVGKGDIQLLNGWNNAQLQTNAASVAQNFRFKQQDRYEIVCMWTTVTGGKTPKTVVHEVEQTRNINANLSIDATARTRNQVNGFILNGYGAGSTGGAVPEVGQSCPGQGNQDGIIEAVTLESSRGGLQVTIGGVAYELANTPTL
jgi:hypothetical protein